MDSIVNVAKMKIKRVAISKELTFDSAHNLVKYQGKCGNLHGHTYRLVICISGYMDEHGFVMDFNELEAICQKVILSKVDHQYLNDLFPDMNTTAENLVGWIWEQLSKAISNEEWKARKIQIESIKLYETPNNYAMLKKEWMCENHE